MIPEEKAGMFRQIFLAMMIFTGLVWVWTVAFIIAWPWQASLDWQPEFRLPARCAGGEICGLAHGEIEAARAAGRLVSLDPGDAGEIEDSGHWLRWKKVVGQPWQIEAQSSSWYFQTRIRYRLDDGFPRLVAYQEVTAKAFYYGMAAALFTLAGLYLRKLRRAE